MVDKNLSIVISTYDSVNDVGVATDIYRKNFNKKYGIVVSCNDISSIESIESLDVDDVVIGSKLQLASDKKLNAYNYSILACRVFESIQNGFKSALNKFDSEYYVHTHSDAWALKEDALNLKAHKSSSKDVYARGRGFAWYGKYSPLGLVDDHFLYLNRRALTNSQLLKLSPFELLPHRNNIHGMLTTVFLGSIGLRNIAFHSDIKDLVYWDGSPIDLRYNFVKPCSYDPDLGFLHVHESAFPGDFGYSIKAHYLYDNKITKGLFIEELLDNHLVDYSFLCEYLSDKEAELDSKLRRCFYDVSLLGRDFSQKERLVTSSNYKTLIKNLIKRIYIKSGKLLNFSHKYDHKIHLDSPYPVGLYDHYLDLYGIDLSENFSFVNDNGLF